MIISAAEFKWFIYPYPPGLSLWNWDNHVADLVVHYGISNTFVLEIPIVYH